MCPQAGKPSKPQYTDQLAPLPTQAAVVLLLDAITIGRLQTHNGEHPFGSNEQPSSSQQLTVAVDIYQQSQA